MEPRKGSPWDLIRLEAAQWVVRLSEHPGNAEIRADFEAWRSADPVHEALFERETAAFEALDRLKALKPLHTLPDPDFLTPRRKASTRPYLRWASAAGLVMTCLLVGTLLTSSLSAPAYATGIGERRLIVLSDGSRIELNTDSRVVVRYSASVRQVDLVRGEAVFDVAPGRRPFLVHTSAGDFQTRQTGMAMRLRPNGATVIVKRGAVDLASNEGSRPASLTRPISAGDKAELSKGSVRVIPVSTEEVDRALAWRQGYISLNGQTLAEAVDEFNRYNATKIFITDDWTTHLRVAGYFSVDDEVGFVTAVSHAFPVTSARRPDGSIALSRKN